MKISDICRKCMLRLVVWKCNGEICYRYCTTDNIYKKLMIKQDYKFLVKTFALSRETGRFVNPAREFRFRIAYDMERDGHVLEFSLDERKLFDMLPDDGDMKRYCPSYAEMLMEKWNQSQNQT